MKILLISLLTVISMSLAGQQYIYLQKGNEVPYKRLEKQDKVTFKLKGEEDWIEGHLQEINEESIKVKGIVYPLKGIEAFRTYNELLHLGGTAISTAGLLFTGIAFFNRLINADRPLLTNGQLIFGAAMVGGGFLVRWLSRKTYERANDWQWKVIDLSKDLKQSGK